MRTTALWGGMLLGILAAARPAAAQASASQQAYYAYEESAGTTAADSSPNNLTGTHSGTVAFSAAGDAPPVPIGNTYSRVFNPGATAYVNTPNNAAITFTGPFTAAAWIKATAAYAANGNANNRGAIVQKWNWIDPPGTINGFGFDRLEDGRIYMLNGTATSYSSPTSTGTVPLNVWTHVAITFDGAFNRIYINGVQDVASAFTIAPGSSTAPLHVGRDDYNRYFYGNIDEVRLFDIALGAAEIGILHGGMPTPGGLAAAPGPNNVTVSWNAVAGAEGYILQVGPSAGGPWTTIPGATSPYTDTAAIFPGTYYYQVAATGLMQSAWAGPVSATPNSITPRTNGHEEGLGDCNCGSSVAAAPAWSSAAFGLLLLLAARRRPRP